jgi:hypothetical protein
VLLENRITQVKELKCFIYQMNSYNELGIFVEGYNPIIFTMKKTKKQSVSGNFITIETN